MTKRFGFTLAEVLITLGIIGVVAAMTIPTLMNSTGEAQYKTGFKKILSTMNQAITMNVALNNTDFSELDAVGAGAGSVFDMFTSRLNVVRTEADTATDLDTPHAQPGGIGAGNYTLFFNDGMALSFPSTITGCITAGSNATCKGIVDVNGVKLPNRLSNCGGTDLATDGGTGVCSATSTGNHIKDRFSVRFYGQNVEPNGNAARYVMYN